MTDDAVIILDPVNRDVIDQGIATNLRTFAGGNCTVSLTLMAVAVLWQGRARRVGHYDDVSGRVRRRRREKCLNWGEDGTASPIPRKFYLGIYLLVIIRMDG